jgi:NAD(P)-dependent dehydrogenase (short-subunit alcohol dehydrogenase family)
MSGKKTAIITVASGGIGGGLVEGFLGEGYNVVATSRDAHRTLTTSSSLVLVDGDIGTRQTAAYAVEAAINNFGTIDVLVNNAGKISDRTRRWTSTRYACPDCFQ